MAVQCRVLDPAGAERFQAWTFPAYRHLLDLRPGTRFQVADPRPIRPLALLGTQDGEPAGLVLGCVPAGTGESALPDDPELLSVYVAPRARCQGMGRLLVGEMESAIAGAGFARAETVYMTGGPGIGFFESVLAHRGWSPPAVRMFVFKGMIRQLQCSPWFGRFELGRGFELFPWSTLGAGGMAALQESHARTGWIAEDLRPWLHSALDASSLGVRYRGEVVGWVLNHRLGDETIRFTCSFMRRDLSRRARILPAWYESVRRAAEAGYRRLTFTVPARHREMAASALRWGAPWLTFRGETRGSSKELG
jgi:ribosomal protein S18 acetylase RimI-like enzyme